jgi:ribosomal protein S12 methylthiotransferase RimO
MTAPVSLHLQSLGCARNDVDSEELAGQFAAAGFTLVAEPDAADVIVVNTCGFIDAAKKDSVDTLLAAAEYKQAGSARAVVAVGCMAERYGAELAEALPEADAVLGFDAYPEIADRVRAILAGDRVPAHVPRDRRLTLVPVSEKRPWLEPAPHDGPASGPRMPRKRLDGGPYAPLKIASGCDRRCSFCSIPSFRGSYRSRPGADVLAEAAWLVSTGVREVMLVSENTTAYGKDFRDMRALEGLVRALGDVEGLARVRLSYLQPAELRDTLLAAMAETPNVVPYLDLSFQHASPAVLRRMKRYGSPDVFLGLLARGRAAMPEAGARSNVIVGFPGETEQELALLKDFLVDADLDAVGVFGYSNEEGTAAYDLPGQLDQAEIDARVSDVAALVDELVAAKAESRIGSRVDVLVESAATAADTVGRAAHQGPEVDGVVVLRGAGSYRAGDIVPAVVVGSSGADLVAEEERHE